MQGTPQARGPSTGLLVQASWSLQQDGPSDLPRKVEGCCRLLCWYASINPLPGCFSTEDLIWKFCLGHGFKRFNINFDSGNHAQGVAYSARHLKIPATITMPMGTPAIKHSNVSRLGGNVVLHGADFDAAKAECGRLEKAHGLTNIPPFDDPYVIAGQGTIGMELVRQADLSKLEAIFCCVGGGGLIAGIGVYIKRIAPHVKIIGVETYDANAMVQSLKLGKRVTLKDVGLFADGAAVKTVGEETFRVASEVVDEVIQVDTDEICAAIKDVFEDTRSILEPAGALSLAGLKKYAASRPSQDTKRQLVAIASGANMNFDRLRFVAERAALGEKKEALLSVTIPERPGAFAALVAAINPMAVTEFCYRYSTSAAANILVGISVAASTRERDLSNLISRLQSEGMQATDLSGDELAKSHIRYLVGGRSNAESERLFAFEFPERQGALHKFLTTLQPGFNISLFHYRNYGGDIARVLAAIQCPAGEVSCHFVHIWLASKQHTDKCSTGGWLGQIPGGDRIPLEGRDQQSYVQDVYEGVRTPVIDDIVGKTSFVLPLSFPEYTTASGLRGFERVYSPCSEPPR